MQKSLNHQNDLVNFVFFENEGWVHRWDKNPQQCLHHHFEGLNLPHQPGQNQYQEGQVHSVLAKTIVLAV